jgi:hypothetical protein
VRHVSWQSPGRRTGGRRAHFRRAERHDRFAGGQKRSGKVAVVSYDGVIDPDRVGPPADRGRPIAVGFGPRLCAIVLPGGTIASAL